MHYVSLNMDYDYLLFVVCSSQAGSMGVSQHGCTAVPARSFRHPGWPDAALLTNMVLPLNETRPDAH
jgi:hypothetical protein